jgi:hypothetical protein
VSDNPYAPPGADLGGEPRGDTTRGRGDFDLGETLSDAWAHTWGNFPLWLWVGIVGALAAIFSIVTMIGIVLLLPVLGWGAILFLLRMHDGGAELGDLFAGFSCYGTALAGILVVGLAFTLLSGSVQVIQIAAERTGEPWLYFLWVLVYLGVFFLVVPRLAFAYFYVVDRDMGPVEALQRAWRVSSPLKWKLAALLLLNYVVIIAGLLALVIGAIPASIMTYLMWVSAYRQTEGRALPA